MLCQLCNLVPLKEGKRVHACYWWMLKGQRSHTHRNIDISLYDKKVIAKKYSGRFLEQIKQCSITSKMYLTREKKEL